MGRFTKNMNRHWRYPTIRPPAIGPSIGSIRPGMATKLMARISSDLANVRTRVSRPTGDHHGSAAALQDATGDQQTDVARYAAKKGPEGEEANHGCKNPTRAETVSHPAADRNEDRKAQRVAGQHRLHAERRDFEGLRNHRHGSVQNRRVQRLHKKGDRDQPR
jgi:hypothetical protein